MIGELAIKTPSPFQAAGLLSGGNQQKLVLAKWLSTSAEIFLLDEPTQGVDVGTKDEIYRLIRGLAASGKAVLVVSSDLEEVLEIGDRILAIRQGRIVDEFRNGRSRPVSAWSKPSRTGRQHDGAVGSPGSRWHTLVGTDRTGDGRAEPRSFDDHRGFQFSVLIS